MSEHEAEDPHSHAAVTTSRLILRPFSWDAVRAIVDGRRFDDWTSDYPTEGDAVIAGILHRAGPGATGPEVRWGHWQVLERSSGLVIGGIGFLAPPTHGEVEMGYGMAPSHQGRGYATEAAQAVVELARADGDVTAVVAGTDHDNRASQRVLEKIGFRCVDGGADLRYILDVST